MLFCIPYFPRLSLESSTRYRLIALFLSVTNISLDRQFWDQLLDQERTAATEVNGQLEAAQVFFFQSRV